MRLDWPDCHNARDVGGLPTASGGRVRRGALIRSDVLDRLTPAGLASVRGYGVSRIIDLRSVEEVAEIPGPFAADAIYRNIPLIDEQADRHRDPVAEATMLATYMGSIDRNGRRIAAGVAAVAGAPPGAVVVHCAAGKDRTGLLVALMLRAVGVADADIAADYALSAEYLRERYAAELAEAPSATDQEKIREGQRCDPNTILGTLAHVDTRHGGTVAYLGSVGLSDRQLALLRTRLLGGGGL